MLSAQEIVELREGKAKLAKELDITVKALEVAADYRYVATGKLLFAWDKGGSQSEFRKWWQGLDEKVKQRIRMLGVQ